MAADGGSMAADGGSMAAAFDAVLNGRYACTRFHRHAEPPTIEGEGEGERERASLSDPTAVRRALHCLNLSRRSPSGFNAQPYRVVLVSSPEAKERLAKSCLGRNADRVRDSDCTAVFLSDREVGRDWKRFGSFLVGGGGGRVRSGGEVETTTGKEAAMGKWARRKIQGLILLFSSGYPLPRFISSPMSFCVRLAVNVLGTVTPRRFLVPTLSSADTWSTKNAMLVAMSYLLGCTSRGLVTCPMEGFWAPGVREALGAPRRFSVPLIVSAGVPYRGESTKERDGTKLVEAEDGETDDVGMSHGAPGGGGGATRRYPLDQVVFCDNYGEEMLLPPQ